MHIDHTGFQLEVRNLFFDDSGKVFVAMTLGRGTYIANMEYEVPAQRNHVLIGNYSSLAHGICFVVGFNHEYKHVTTFPINYPTILQQFQNLYPDVTESPGDYSSVPKHDHRQIIIGHDVWLGARVTVLGGARIGSGAVIGTNSVVAKNIPPYAIAVGNPARVVKYRFDEETIKKFMAVRWWNWDMKKIFSETPLMNEPEKFLEKHYSPDLEQVSENNLGGGAIDENIFGRKKIFTFVADMHAPQPLWKRVITGFGKSDWEDSLLIILMENFFTQDNLQTLRNYIDVFGNGAGKNILIAPATDEKFSLPQILGATTHFIASREIISLECIDRLWNSDAKIVSALDDGIFDGEPDVQWDKIFD